MPRSRPSTSPLSFHGPTGQYYVTRARKRIYLGTDPKEALKKYYRLALGGGQPARPECDRTLTAKELANRFIAAQQANWRDPEGTLRCYADWLGRFLKDHPGLLATDFTVEKFASWKLSLRRREYSAESINHFLSAVRAMYAFAADIELLPAVPRLRRVRNEPCPKIGSRQKPIYTADELRKLLDGADLQLKGMLLLGLNCGFGPKDLADLRWDDICDGRVTLPRSKTGVCQTYALWPETEAHLGQIRESRRELRERIAKRNPTASDDGHIFVTRYWRPWNKDATAEEFRKLCTRVDVPCYGFYRLRHCASTAMSLVATPHVHRKFMRHSQLQTQVTYTHTPDDEVDSAVMRARERLLGLTISNSGNGQGLVGGVAGMRAAPAGQAGRDAPETRSRLPA
jgi:integrase